MTTLPITIRTFAPGDLAKVVAIEGVAQVVPWSKASFERCLEVNYPSWVLECEGEIIGFVMMSLNLGECHVLNLCIHPVHQRKGLGRELLASALGWAKERGAGIVYLEVRRSNHHAIALYRNMNFKVIGERKAYYLTPKGPEDALVFARDLGIEGERGI